MSKNHGPDGGFRFERRKETMQKNSEDLYLAFTRWRYKERVISRSHGVDGSLALVLANESGRDSQSRIANQPEIERSSDELEGRRVLLGE
jgi:hypothetical protein